MRDPGMLLNKNGIRKKSRRLYLKDGRRGERLGKKLDVAFLEKRTGKRSKTPTRFGRSNKKGFGRSLRRILPP